MSKHSNTKFFLLHQLVRRDVEARHKGTAGGWVWLIGQPLLMLAIYTVVFGLIFKPQWKGVDSIWDYSLILFLGKIPYIYMMETLGRSPGLIIGHSNYAKRIQFPLELLVVMSTATALIMAGISLAIWAGYYVVLHQALPPIAILWVPLLYLPMVVSLMGVSLFVSSLGTYFRDTSQIIQPLVFSMMFISPVFYPLSVTPEWLRKILMFNPLSVAIEGSRAVLYFGASPDWNWWGWQLFSGLILLLLGWAWFARTKGGFAEVI